MTRTRPVRAALLAPSSSSRRAATRCSKLAPSQFNWGDYPPQLFILALQPVPTTPAGSSPPFYVEFLFQNAIENESAHHAPADCRRRGPDWPGDHARLRRPVSDPGGRTEGRMSVSERPGAPDRTGRHI